MTEEQKEIIRAKVREARKTHRKMRKLKIEKDINWDEHENMAEAWHRDGGRVEAYLDVLSMFRKKRVKGRNHGNQKNPQNKSAT